MQTRIACAIVWGRILLFAAGTAVLASLPACAAGLDNFSSTVEPLADTDQSIADRWGPDIVSTVCSFGVGEAVGRSAGVGGEAGVGLRVAGALVGLVICHYADTKIEGLLLPVTKPTPPQLQDVLRSGQTPPFVADFSSNLRPLDAPSSQRLARILDGQFSLTPKHVLTVDELTKLDLARRGLGSPILLGQVPAEKAQ